ncbi:MAG: 6-carboxytetrahydropterin synthase [Gammaproteobacteria bacterium]|jgi:6-pyruvoyl-tetrahydropterin synthase
MTILFVKGLTVMDFSYLHAERGLLGESWIVDVTLHGSLDEQGMVLDFSDVKKQVKRLVDERFDHKLIVPIESGCTKIDSDPEQPVVTFSYGSHGEAIVHRSPPSALCLLDAIAVTTETVADAIETDLMDIMPANVEKIEITLCEETIDGAFYHYSHGLKQHCGNCQRIAHGHRSKIEIFRNGERDLLLEEQWAERWRDIYIGSREDLVEQSPERHHYRYKASQGEYDLVIPADRCYLIDTDSTVENLAAHVAEVIGERSPRDEIRVFAYEGVGKGAVGIATG